MTNQCAPVTEVQANASSRVDTLELALRVIDMELTNLRAMCAGADANEPSPVVTAIDKTRTLIGRTLGGA